MIVLKNLESAEDSSKTALHMRGGWGALLNSRKNLNKVGRFPNQKQVMWRIAITNIQKREWQIKGPVTKEHPTT
jgi:hypothetical protein